ncbi:histidine kinase N-terminal 7TM domain-containing diguanylate cyclase [Paenibacillus albus]|uniref:Diguanylate cyclase n=1 Tax=Paenibacillus albus TaxID=2495582 RepID=A0A3Q8X3T1_9BACL|nr:histidine kinase N-terminal 7TM domain-containing protein [Paenibacillus albus]AZN39773.1 diguanylate cyclase [Paenibacillus albus]
MGTPYSAILTLMVTAGVINVIMGIYVFFYRAKQSMSKTFIAFTLLSAVYVFGSTLELSSTTLAEVKLWIKVEYFGMPFLPPLNLLLVMYFLGMDRLLKRSIRIAMFVLPAITLVLVLSNDMHGLYYRSIELKQGASFIKANLNAGPWYIIAGAYTFGCMIGGVTLLLIYWNRMKSSYRLQHMTMLVALLLPLAGDFLYLGNLTPDGIDPIPSIMAVTSALYMWALAGRGMLNVVPIARDNLFESMSDSVLVLDLENRLVDYNPAAALVMPDLSEHILGKQLDELWQRYTDEPLANLVNGLQDEREVIWSVGARSYHYSVRSSVVRKSGASGGQEVGKLLILIDISEQVELQKKLHSLAFHDGLTGIYNRNHFLHLSEQLIAQSVESDGGFAVLLFDIDYFKRINDTYGHDVGDQALLHVVTVCRRMLRDGDVFARYGGEEFVVALPGMSLTEAGQAAERIRAEIAFHPMSLPAESIAITASFGVAAGDRHADYEVKQLLKLADQALYDAKHRGRNRVSMADYAVAARG